MDVVLHEPANPSKSLFENCFKSYFDTEFRIYVKSLFYWYQGYLLRCFMRRVMAETSFVKNFGPNVVYFVLGTLLIAARLIDS